MLSAYYKADQQGIYVDICMLYALNILNKYKLKLQVVLHLMEADSKWRH